MRMRGFLVTMLVVLVAGLFLSMRVIEPSSEAAGYYVLSRKGEYDLTLTVMGRSGYL
jgi:hypothetical protein